MTEENPSEYSQADWQGHYEADDLRWDLGVVSPPLERLWKRGALPRGTLIVPGCGQGHEVVYFAEQGLDVTGVDFAPGAVARLTANLERKNLTARVLNQDFFALDHTHDNYYDVVLEQTFFCAISPVRRPDYVDTAWRILKPGGIVAGLFYETGEEGGPPFNTTARHIRDHFGEKFHIELLEKCDHSAERRQGKELLAILRKPGS